MFSVVATCGWDLIAIANLNTPKEQLTLSAVQKWLCRDFQIPQFTDLSPYYWMVMFCCPGTAKGMLDVAVLVPLFMSALHVWHLAKVAKDRTRILV